MLVTGAVGNPETSLPEGVDNLVPVDLESQLQSNTIHDIGRASSVVTAR